MLRTLDWIWYQPNGSMMKVIVLPFETASGNSARKILLWPMPESKVLCTWCMHACTGTRSMCQPTQLVTCGIRGHLSHLGMQMLANKELLLEVKKMRLEKCPNYSARKHYRAMFRPRPLMRRKNALKLVHMDVCLKSVIRVSLNPDFYNFGIVTHHQIQLFEIVLDARASIPFRIYLRWGQLLQYLLTIWRLVRSPISGKQSIRMINLIE